MYGGNEQKLFEDLFRHYNKLVRPVWNSSHAINVTLTLSINQINDMDERNQILTTNVWIEQHWHDEKLVWDPDAYEGINILRIPATEIWIPDVTLYDNADSNDYVAHSRSSNALVNYNGNVDLWSKPTLVKSTCKIDVKFFPFDEQMCSMKFGSWTYNSFQMNLDKHTDDPDLSTFVANEQWHMKYAVSRRHNVKYECCPERYHDVTFYIGLKRKPLYYIYNLVMPCILLSSLSMLGFFMPYDVGVVKVSLSVTLILSLTVFLLLVAEMMPRTSEEVPLIGQYYAATMFLISLSTAMNVLVLNVNQRGKIEGQDVPRWLRIIALDYAAKLLCVTPCTGNSSRRSGRDASDYRQYAGHYSSQNHHVTFNGTHQRMESNAHGTLNTYGQALSRNSMHVRFGTATSPAPTESDMLLEDRDVSGGELETMQEKRLARLERTVTDILKHMKTLQKRRERQNQLKSDWGKVAQVLDRVLLLVFVLCTMATALVLLLRRSPGVLAPPDDE
ncbi:neuronal acetylcholine receptor subunit alpha-10-like [Diadema antillarum]|uniref:neuronal acetylcholine receptor subunit alpha-10-like n=1 Tax=Diadema antillarum TaxID=105358 RepID=UPI003A861B44